MKIIHLIDNIDTGGAQDILALFADSAIRNDANLIFVSLYGMGRVGLELSARNQDVRCLARTFFEIPLILPRLLGILIRERPDVVNCHLEISTLTGLYLLKNIFPKIKLIVSIHAIRRQLPSWYYPLVSLACGGVDGVVVEDYIAKKEIVDAGVDAAKVEYIPIATALVDRYSPESRKCSGMLKEFGLSESEKIVLNVSRLHPSKGHLLLIRAFRSVAAAEPLARLIIVGGGVEEPKCKALVDELALSDKIVFAGVRRDLEKFYMDADLFAGASTEEGMGVVIYQAMAMGLPVVAFDAGSIREIVASGRTGELVPCGDVEALAESMIRFLRKPRLDLLDIGSSGRTVVVANHSPRIMVSRYFELYTKVITGT